MGDINQGRYDRLLRRTAAQVGPGSKVSNALEDLFPVIEVEDAPMELLRASGWIFGMGQIQRTAAAATENAQQLFNPPGSGRLMVLTSLQMMCTVLTTLTYGPTFVALADASVAGAERDTRAGRIEATVGLMQREDDGTASLFGVSRKLANTPFEMSDQNGIAVLAPGSGFVVHAATAALTVFTSWQWRERVAEPEELDF